MRITHSSKPTRRWKSTRSLLWAMSSLSTSASKYSTSDSGLAWCAYAPNYSRSNRLQDLSRKKRTNLTNVHSAFLRRITSCNGGNQLSLPTRNITRRTLEKYMRSAMCVCHATRARSSSKNCPLSIALSSHASIISSTIRSPSPKAITVLTI